MSTENKTNKQLHSVYVLMNHNTVFEVANYRRNAVKAGIAAMIGGEPEYRRMIRNGDFVVVKGTLSINLPAKRKAARKTV